LFTRVTVKSTLGNATEHLVDWFYNLYDPEDDGLQFKKEFKNHDPLGLVGAPSGTTTPSNHNDTNVAMKYPRFLMQMEMATLRSALRI